MTKMNEGNITLCKLGSACSTKDRDRLREAEEELVEKVATPQQFSTRAPTLP